MYKNLTYEVSNCIHYIQGTAAKINQYIKENLREEDNFFSIYKKNVCEGKINYYSTSSYKTKKEMNDSISWLQNEYIPSMKDDEVFRGKELKFITL